MKNESKQINMFKQTFNILLLLSVNLNQAIKCCSIIDAYNTITDNNMAFKENELYIEIINCVFRDMLMSVSRMFDETDKNPCNIKELKKYIKNEPNYIFNEEEKSKIFIALKSLQNEYNKIYKKDRNKKLAHTDYNNIYNFNKSKYTYNQVKEFVIKTKNAFELILSFNKDSSIPFNEIDNLKNKYLLLFK